MVYKKTDIWNWYFVMIFCDISPIFLIYLGKKDGISLDISMKKFHKQIYHAYLRYHISCWYIFIKIIYCRLIYHWYICYWIYHSNIVEMIYHNFCLIYDWYIIWLFSNLYNLQYQWYTVFPGKMSYIMTLFIVEGKITGFWLLGVFKVLNEVIWGQYNIYNACLTSATPTFDFQLFSNFVFPIKIYWVIY